MSRRESVAGAFLAFSVAAALLMLKPAQHKKPEASNDTANHRVKVLFFMSCSFADERGHSFTRSIQQGKNAVHDLGGHGRTTCEPDGSVIKCNSLLRDYWAAVSAARVASSAGKKLSMRISCRATSCGDPKVVRVEKNRSVESFHL